MLTTAPTTPLKFSDQLVTIGIVLCVPLLKIDLLHSDELMGDSTIVLVHHTFLADGIASPTWDEVDPEVVVHSAS